MWITTEVEINEIEILDEFDDRDLLEELERRNINFNSNTPESIRELVDKIYHLRRTGEDYQTELTQLFWQILGRI